MLPKENRLKRKKEFEEVFKGGKTIKGNYVFLKYLAGHDGKTKVGFVVSKKVSKLAVVRNKVKRRMREIVRLRKKEIKNGMRTIFIALTPSKDAKYEELEKEIADLLEKIK